MSINLNENQKIAVFHSKGAMMVLAGPGSGKTTVITYRIKNLIENLGVNFKEILVITFTKAAAIEMKNRCLLLNNTYNQVNFLTFHSLFFKIINEFYNYTLKSVLHEFEKINILKNIVSELNLSYEIDEDFFKNLCNEISFVKNELINPIDFDSNYISSVDFFKIYSLYEDYKNKYKKIDFDDMLIKSYEVLSNNKNVREFWKEKYKYILIDEFQDINKIQFECIKLILNNKNNIFVVGDDDQSIYGFRGSRPDFLLNFPKEFKTEKVILETNYRSTNEIINFCNSIIQVNTNRYEKAIKGTGKSFKLPILVKAYDLKDEAKKLLQKIIKLNKKIPLEKMAIIYRTNLQATLILELLIDYNLEYQCKDSINVIYSHFIVKDIIAYLNLSINKFDNVSFSKIANKPKRYLNKSLINESVEKSDENISALEYLYLNMNLKSWQLEKVNRLLFNLGILKSKSPYDAVKYILEEMEYDNYLEDYADAKNIAYNGLFEICKEFLEISKNYSDIESFLDGIDKVKEEISKNKYQNKSNGITLTTMHSSKGLEFDVVFVIGCIESVIPHEKAKSLHEIEEERRLFYVAITRAKKMLYLFTTKYKYEKPVKISSFLEKFIK